MKAIGNALMSRLGLGLVLMLVGGATVWNSWNENSSHHAARAHSDERWKDIDSRIDSLASVCRLKDRP